MTKIYFIEKLNSKYCRFVFLISMIISYLLIPNSVFHSKYFIFGFVFILTTSLTITCIVKNIKEKVVLAKSSGASLISIIMIVFGLGALQVCTIGSSVCTASVVASSLTIFFPEIAIQILTIYSVPIIILSIILQIISLYFLGCFRREPYTPQKRKL